MKDVVNGEPFTFHELPWDTKYFGIQCAKAILNKSLNLSEWNRLSIKLKEYKFISIENRNSEPVNAQLIGTNTSAFLADVNIQFKKQIINTIEISDSISVHQTLSYNDHLLKLANFQYSKFVEDPELLKRGGDKIYQNWLINSFDKSEKHFALAKSENKIIEGFLLFSYNNEACIIELIAVSELSSGIGNGTKLFKAVENVAQKHGCKEIRVGTQIRNKAAINFYHKVGCHQQECHQIYHLWTNV